MRGLHATVLVLSLALSSATALAAGRVALVVGNSAYESTNPLPNPQRDASAIAEKLESLDFEVILAVDADRRATIRAIDDFSRALVGADVGLFFFAGHGIQIGGQNFLLPTDVEADSERALRYSAIDAQEVIAEMERSANVSIAILDACRDNPLIDEISKQAGATRSANVSRGLGRMQLSGRGALVAFAAAAGDTAADGTGDHSPYTQALLEEIDQPNVEVGLMFRRVARKVRDATRGDQQPELLVRLVDEVYLNPVAVQAAPLPVPPVQEGATDTAVTVEADATADDDKEIIVVEAATGTDDSGPPRTSSERYFGSRVVHPPTWLEGLALPAPTGWRSGTPASVAEYDGNDSFGTAQKLPLAASVELRQTPRGDVDWFYVDVPTAGELRIEVNDAPDELDLWARVWNSDHKVAADWQGAPRPGGALYAQMAIPGPGRYWFELVDGNRDKESSDLIVMSVDFIAADDPFEPNNSFGNAWPIPSTTKFDAYMYPKGDVDWYRVWIPEPGLLSATITRVPDDLDVFLRMWDLNGKVVADWAGPPRKGGDTIMDASLAAPGVYMIEMVDGNRDAASIEPVSVDFAFYPVADPYEPNPSFGEAALVEPIGRYKAAIFPRGDKDWWAFDVHHPGEITFTATNSPKDLDIFMRVWDSDKDVLRDWFGPGREGGDVIDFADLPSAGRYFLEIVDGNNNAASPDLFDLELAYIPQPDQYEPNNNQVDAAPLTPGRTVLFNILPRGDKDWFRVEVDSPGELMIVLDESPKDLDLYFRVWNADRKVVRDWVAPYRQGGLAEGFADLPAPGVYFIEVVDGNNDARSVEHATLTTTFTPIAETYEPNNLYGSPTPLALGATAWASILPKGDKDWYELQAPRAGTFYVTIDEVHEDLDIFVRLWNSEVKAGSWFGPPRKGGVTEAEISVEQAGLYRLEVVDGNNDARSPTPFRLKVDFQ